MASLPGLTEEQQVGNDSDVMLGTGHLKFLHPLHTYCSSVGSAQSGVGFPQEYLKDCLTTRMLLASEANSCLTARHEIQSATWLSTHHQAMMHGHCEALSVTSKTPHQCFRNPASFRSPRWRVMVQW